METVTWNSLTYKIINISGSEDAREIVTTCKNKWKSPWLEEKDENGDYLSTHVRKINISGSVFCIYCIKPYHLPLLPLHWRKPTSGSSNDISTCTPLTGKYTMPYGVAENVHTNATCPSLKENTLRPIVSVSDRKHHLEAYILSFAENWLLLSIEFSQFLSRDPKALSEPQMNRTAASY